MRRPFVQAIDRGVIRFAAERLARVPDCESRVEEAQACLDDPGFFGDERCLPNDMEVADDGTFRCASAVPSPVPESDRVFGRLYRASGDAWSRPTIVMLHGWNGENCHRWLFPRLAGSANRRGMNLLAFELPCHGRRREVGTGPESDFISPNLVRTVMATRQAIQDTRMLVGWLRGRGVPSVHLWGISLGAWIAGLLACHDPRIASAVLMVPITRMDRAIETLPFCAPIRRGLRGAKIQFQRLNLPDYQPRIPKENILLVAGRHDLFAPQETVEELWEAWGRPPIHWTAHGHISILFSWPTMRRVLRRIERWSAHHARYRH